MGADIDLNSNDLLNVRNIEAQFFKDENGVLVAFANYTGTVASETFSGDSSTLTFAVTVTPVASSNLSIYIYGVYQQKATYTVSGSSITFSEAPPLGTDNIEIIVISSLPIGSTTADLVGYTPAGSGAVPTTVEAKLRESVSVKDFGAVGDGVADDTAAINAALAAARVVRMIPGDTYKISSTIDISGKTLISDAMIGLEAPIIQPTAAVTSYAILTGSYTFLSGIFVDGTNASSITGIYVLGNLVKLVDTSVYKFATGVFIASSVSTWCTNLRLTENTVGMYMSGLTGSFPTLTSFRDCQFFRNTVYGAQVIRGNQTKFYNCLFEENGAEGLLVDALDVVPSMEVIGCFFEDNGATYQLTMSTAGGAETVDHIAVRDCFFFGGTKSAIFSRVFQLTFEGNHIPEVAATVLFEVNTSAVIRSQFLDVDNGYIVIDSVNTDVTDPTDYTFVPSIEGNVTAGVGTYSVQTGRYQQIGRMVTVTINLVWSTHTGAGTGIRIGALPVTSSATGYGSMLTGVAGNITLTAGNYFTGASVRTSAITADLFQAPTGGGAQVLIPFDTSGSVVLTGSYFVD